MARIVVTPTAVDDLDRLIATHRLPDETRERVKASLGPLQRFPRLGRRLTGRWRAYRFLLGPWSWMLIVYAYEEEVDRVLVVTIQDSRAAHSVTAEGRQS